MWVGVGLVSMYRGKIKLQQWHHLLGGTDIIVH